MSVLSVDRVEVGEGRLDATVRVLDPASMRTCARSGLPAKAMAALPGLQRHTCENESGGSFVEELRDTETPHLLEHVACELMALAGSPRSLRGETSWDFARDGAGIFHVRLAFDEDVVALGALKEALAIVDGLFGVVDMPDVDLVAERLRRLRSQPASD